VITQDRPSTTLDDSSRGPPRPAGRVRRHPARWLLRDGLHQAAPAYLVSGQFSRGTITVSNPGAGCTDQVYTVDGDLRNVSVTGTGHVLATLTHHRRSVLGRCWLYAATVSGTVALA
jgi:hypothetical protein